MSRVAVGILGAAVCLAVAAPARAESPKTGVLEVKLGSYFPQVDAETGIQNAIAAGTVTHGPYEAAFNNKHILLFQLEYDYELFQSFGSISVGFSAGYGEVYGKGLFDSTSTISSDTTSLKVWPLKLLAVYRFDILDRRYDIPLVPFFKGGLVYEVWRISNGAGDTATSNGNTGSGGNWGWEGDLGLGFNLGWIDHNLASDMDMDLGINRVYLFGEWSDMAAIRSSPWSQPDRIRLNDKFFNFGLAFEF